MQLPYYSCHIAPSCFRFPPVSFNKVYNIKHVYETNKGFSHQTSPHKYITLNMYMNNQSAGKAEVYGERPIPSGSHQLIDGAQSCTTRGFGRHGVGPSSQRHPCLNTAPCRPYALACALVKYSRCHPLVFREIPYGPANPLKIEILPESKPLKSRILVWILSDWPYRTVSKPNRSNRGLP